MRMVHYAEKHNMRIDALSRGALLLENLDLGQATMHLLLGTRGGYSASERCTNLDDAVRMTRSKVCQTWTHKGTQASKA